MRGAFSGWLVMLFLLLTGTASAAAVDNHPPTINPSPAVTLVEDQATAVVILSGIGDGEASPSGQVISVSAMSADTTRLNVTLMYAGGTTAILLLTPAPNRSGTVTVQVTVQDDGGGSDTTTLAIPVTITPVDDPPSVVAPVRWEINEDESDAAKLQIVCTQLSPGPADEAAQTVTAQAWTEGASPFSIASVTTSGGTLTIAIHTKPDQSGQGHVYLQLSDGTNLSDYSILVIVDPVPDPPVITAGSPVAVARGSAVALTTAALAVTDADGNNVTITVVAAPQHGELRYNGVRLGTGGSFQEGTQSFDSVIADGRLTYYHDGSAGTADTAQFSCRDTAFPAASAPVTVAFVIGGRAKPWVTLPDSATWEERSGPAALFRTANILDPDSPIFDGGSIQVAITYNAVDKILLDVANLGTDPGQVSRLGSTVLVGGIPIGTVSLGHGVTPLVITFSGPAATRDAVVAVLQAVTFDVPNNTGISYPLAEVTVDDGQDGRSPPATMTIYTSENLDELPLLPSGLRLATLQGLSRNADLGAYEPDQSTNNPVWSVVSQPANAIVTMLTNSTASGPVVRLVPTAAGSGEVVFKVLDSAGRSALTHVPVLVLATPEDARPHPQADPPREVLAGEAVDLIVPWDIRDIAADTKLRFATAGVAPSGLVLTAVDALRVRVTWPVPAATPAGSRYRLQVLAEEPTHGVLGFLPFDVTVRTRPVGGG